MENNTPTQNISNLDQEIGASFDSSLTTENSDVQEEPEIVQEEQQPETEIEQEEQDIMGGNENSEAEDSFTPTSYDELPDELKPLHKSLQADYTRKRQLERQQVKDLETKLADLESKLENADQTTDDLESDEYISEEDRIRNYIKAEREAEWEKQAQTEIVNLDNRLNDNHPDSDKFFDTFARDILEQRLVEHEQENGTKLGFDYKSVLNEVSDEWQSYIDGKIKSYIANQNKIMKKNAVQTKKSNPSTKSANVERSGNMSFDEAVASAFNK